MVRWKLLKVFALLLGIASIALAVLVFTGSVGYSEGYLQYEGDAYTGIQNAAAQTANNIVFLGRTIRMALSALLLMQGLVMFLGGLCIRTKAAKAKPVTHKQPVAPVQPVAPAQPIAEPVFQPPVAQQLDHWICPNCGTKNELDYQFCQGCGKSK